MAYEKIYYLTVSGDLEPRCGLDKSSNLCLYLLPKPAIKVWAGASLRKLLSSLLWLLVEFSSSGITGLRASASPCSLATGCPQFLDTSLSSGQLPTWQLPSLQWAGEREQENKEEVTVLYNLILEQTSHHFFSIACVITESLDSAYTQRMGITQESKCRSWG